MNHQCLGVGKKKVSTDVCIFTTCISKRLNGMRSEMDGVENFSALRRFVRLLGELSCRTFDITGEEAHHPTRSLRVFCVLIIPNAAFLAPLSKICLSRRSSQGASSNARQARRCDSLADAPKAPQGTRRLTLGREEKIVQEKAPKFQGRHPNAVDITAIDAINPAATAVLSEAHQGGVMLVRVTLSAAGAQPPRHRCMEYFKRVAGSQTWRKTGSCENSGMHSTSDRVSARIVEKRTPAAAKHETVNPNTGNTIAATSGWGYWNAQAQRCRESSVTLDARLVEIVRLDWRSTRPRGAHIWAALRWPGRLPLGLERNVQAAPGVPPPPETP